MSTSKTKEAIKAKKTLPEGFTFDKDGRLTKQVGEKIVNVAATRFEVLNLTKNAKGNRGWGYRVKLTDSDGKQHIEYLSAKELRNDQYGVIERLADIGFDILSFRYYLEFLIEMKRHITTAPITCINQLGWNESELVFACVDKVYKKEENTTEYIFLDSDSGKVLPVTQMQGELKEYQENVVPLIQQDSVLIVSLCAALSNILQGLSEVENGGLLFYGDSSTGKTTALQVFASVFGVASDPSIRSNKSNFIIRFNATKNGMEARCRQYSGVGMAIDELGSFIGRNVGTMIYDFAGGQGKSVMDSSRNLVEPKRWRFIFVVSGEESMQEKILNKGETLKTGMAVRIVSNYA